MHRPLGCTAGIKAQHSNNLFALEVSHLDARLIPPLLTAMMPQVEQEVIKMAAAVPDICASVLDILGLFDSAGQLFLGFYAFCIPALA